MIVGEQDALQRRTRPRCYLCYRSQVTRLSIVGMSSLPIARLETYALAPAFLAAERWLESSKPETMTTDV